MSKLICYISSNILNIIVFVCNKNYKTYDRLKDAIP